MKKAQQKTLIVWIKKALGFTAIILWTYIIYSISKSQAPFMEQAPYCMVSTMMIFGLLSLGFKGLEYWEKQIKSSSK